MGNDSWSPYSMQKYATTGTRRLGAEWFVMLSGIGSGGRGTGARGEAGRRLSSRTRHDRGLGAVALFHHPAHGLAARARAAQALELRHRLHALFHGELTGHDPAQRVRVEPHVAARHVAVVQDPGEVAQVRVDVGERLAVDA